MIDIPPFGLTFARRLYEARPLVIDSHVLSWDEMLKVNSLHARSAFQEAEAIIAKAPPDEVMVHAAVSALRKKWPALPADEAQEAVEEVWVAMIDVAQAWLEEQA